MGKVRFKIYLILPASYLINMYKKYPFYMGYFLYYINVGGNNFILSKLFLH